MVKTNSPHTFERLLDANLNRFKEGVRVVEDVLRYLYDHPALAFKLRNIRHSATDIITKSIPDVGALYVHRNSAHDVLQESDVLRTSKQPILHMVQANFKRAQESARVLEECLKYAYPSQPPPTFKTLRYELYTLEKECIALLAENSLKLH
ncbi:thiamine-phosphate pyrophosphorylase [Helicobacter baculiformis]|uniref:Thiamine-phosphate pyrophosphorylase n=1 Tax=Helicobacter baculiformis TaxID=427351 RepID=A0ABV7ZIS5_9HELI|nr:thiamine-phosphate pyrophosphorylase [Helicobacter baculiformis]